MGPVMTDMGAFLGRSALTALERRLRVVESDGPVEDAITGFGDKIDHGPGPVPAGLACAVRCTAHGGDRGRGHRPGEPVAHQVG